MISLSNNKECLDFLNQHVMDHNLLILHKYPVGIMYTKINACMIRRPVNIQHFYQMIH